MHDNEKYSIFLVTKPLQYFNVTNIYDKNWRICLIVNYFNNAKNIFKKIQNHSNYWNESYFFENTFEACDWVLKNKKNIENLYLDGDYGFRKYLFLNKLSQVNIFVYEEGEATYLKSLIDNNIRNNRLIKLLYRYMGHQDFIGGSKYTKGIYVYDIEKHRLSMPDCKKELKTFKESFLNHLNSFEDKDLFLSDKTKKILKAVKNRKVILYLATWLYDFEVDKKIYDSKVDKTLLLYPDFIKIIKPHPHIKHDFNEFQSMFDYSIEGGDIAEYFIFEVLKQTEELIVMHHGTSALLYFEHQKNLKSIII